jgi:6-phosphogluconolactonase (cycloisomerase 2 family)
MMFRSFRRAALAIAFSLGLAPLLTSCGNGHTFGFAYVLSSPSSTSSSVWVYKINNETGRLSAADTPSVPNPNYNNPVYTVISPDNNYVYVLYGPTINENTGLPNPNGQDAIIVYGITHENGNITPLVTYNTGGTEPVSLTIDPSGKFLYAVDFYQEAYSNASPGPGDLTIFQLGTGSAIGTLVTPPCTGGLTTSTPNGDICYYPVGYSPRAAAQTADGKFVYVTNSGLSTQTCSSSISGFSINANGFTPVNFTPGACIPSTPSSGALAFGSQPWAITTATVDPTSGNLTLLQTLSIGSSSRNILVDSTNSYLYVSSSASNNISAFNIAGSGSTAGQLTAMSSSPFSTGTLPLCLATEAPFLFAVNQISGSVTGFEIGDSSSSAPGALTVINKSPFQVGPSSASGPTCMAIAPVN